MNTKGVEDGITDAFNEGVKAAAKVFEDAGMIHNEVYALLKPPTLPVPERTAEMEELMGTCSCGINIVKVADGFWRDANSPEVCKDNHWHKPAVIAAKSPDMEPPDLVKKWMRIASGKASALDEALQVIQDAADDIFGGHDTDAEERLRNFLVKRR